MQTLKNALVASRSDHPGLENLLFGRLLPVLVSSRELMTVEELTWAVGGGADLKDVSWHYEVGSTLCFIQKQNKK